MRRPDDSGDGYTKEGSMAAKAVPEGRALTATIERVGRLPRVLAGDANAGSADLRITLRGGTSRMATKAQFAVALNVRVGSEGTPSLIDEIGCSAHRGEKIARRVCFRACLLYAARIECDPQVPYNER
jgi:hypothetical protein